jgi:hypothetical protein
MNCRPPSGAFCLKAEACRLHNRDDVVPGMIGAIQTHGELLHWHPHIHVLITCGAFTPEGDFLEFPEFDMERLLVAWQDAVFELYLAEEKIEAEVVENMRSWEHSGFSVDQSVFLPAGDQAGKDQSQLTLGICLYVLPRFEASLDRSQISPDSEKTCGVLGTDLLNQKTYGNLGLCSAENQKRVGFSLCHQRSGVLETGRSF